MGSAPLVIALSLAACRWNFDPQSVPDDAADAAIDPDASPFAANLVFATSTTHAMLGMTLVDADAICMQRAADAQLPGTYRAWLSTVAEPAISRFGNAEGWIRRDGKLVVQSIADIMASRMLHPILFDETGTRLESSVVVATGTNGNGSTFSTLNCGDFTGGQNLVFGCPDATGRSYSVCANTACIPAKFYCWGIDRVAPITIPTTAGRKAFLGTGFSSGNSTSSADTHCNTIAANLQLPGTYKALLSSTTVPAASRFSVAGETWVRLDGIPLAPTAADVLAGTWDAPLNTTQAGGYDDGFVWTGATTIGEVGTPDGTCDDLLSTSNALTPKLGRASRVFPAAFDESVGVTCGTSGSVYCLQE